MATVSRIHKTFRGQLYLREHREARGISATQMGNRLGIHRESVYRAEKHWTRIARNSDKLREWAAHLGIDDPQILFHPPDRPPRPSLDAELEQLPPEVQDLAHGMAADILRRFAGNRR